MKAIQYFEYGPPEVLQLKEVEKPAPKEDEILIRVHATSVGFGDLLARNFGNVSPREFTMPLPLYLPVRMYFGFKKPKIRILGAELAGEVEAVGKEVKRFKAGDQVFAYLGQPMGAYAEYVCLSEEACVAVKPANMTYQEAAVMPYGGIMALNLLRKTGLQPGQKVLIIGASGGIGSAMVQLASSHFGAEVTGVCGAPRMAFVKALGAARVIDYKREDFSTNGQTYDVIIDILGKGTFSRSKSSLSQNGRYLYVSFKMKHLFQMLWTKLTGGKRVICAMASDKYEDLNEIRELVEAGKLKAIIDRCFPLEMAAEAHRYVEDGYKKGHVVLSMEMSR